MTDRLTEIEARLEAATPGPWSGVTELDEWLTLHPENMRKGGAYITFGERFAGEWSSNANFIAHSPEDIRWLVAEVKRRDETIRLFEEEVKRLRKRREEDALGERTTKLYPETNA